MNLPEVFFLEPNRVWRTYLGGKQLDQLEGQAEPADGHFPEDWIASTTRAKNVNREDHLDEGLSRLYLDGQAWLLRGIFAQAPEYMLGAAHAQKFGPNTQFLLKFLDSSIRLHLQCHPTIKFANTYLNSPSGKTEAYIIMGTRDDNASIYLGFQHVPKLQDFRQAILAQELPRILACFEPIPIRRGDVFIVPGGVPHAIGAGVFMIEIMEPTDFAVRIEFERGGYVLPEEARFMGRDVDFALSMFNFEEMRVAEVRRRLFQTPRLIKEYHDGSAEYVLIDEQATRCFQVKKLKIAAALRQQEDSFYVGIVTAGTGRVTSGNTRQEVKLGDRFLVPYATPEVIFESRAGMEVVYTLPPKP
jgi:mannose-6-phosphate isomerase